MPIEASLLNGTKPPLERCPKCGAEPFDPFLRGMVHLSGLRAIKERLRCWWHGKEYAYCALICWKCKEIVGYE